MCLDAKVPPWSFHNGRQSGGFDAAVANAVARRLGRKLTLRWFETKLDEDFSTTLAANALLSDRVCQLVGGYPLFESALGEPGMKSAPLAGLSRASSRAIAAARSRSEFWCRAAAINSRR